MDYISEIKIDIVDKLKYIIQIYLYNFIEIINVYLCTYIRIADWIYEF